MMSLSVFSQSGYPKVLIESNDTFVVLTLDQVDSLNIQYTNLKYCRNYTDSLEKAESSLNKMVFRYWEIIKNLQDKEALSLEERKATDEFINWLREELEQATVDKQKCTKQNKKLKKVIIGETILLILVIIIAL